MISDAGDVTGLLNALRTGQPDAESRLLPVVYRELRRLASAYLRKERRDHPLQATELVHEAYLRMAGTDAPWQNRVHFFAVAAKIMRRILVDHARAHRAAKRGDGHVKLPLDEALALSAAESQQLIDLDEALSRLAQIDARWARIVELRFFGGLSVEETAAVLGVSTRTVHADWAFARAWLFRTLSDGDAQ